MREAHQSRNIYVVVVEMPEKPPPPPPPRRHRRPVGEAPSSDSSAVAKPADNRPWLVLLLVGGLLSAFMLMCVIALMAVIAFWPSDGRKVAERDRHTST